MPRGYRRILIAAFGIAIIGASSALIYSRIVPYSAALQHEAVNRAEIHRQNAERRIDGVCAARADRDDCIAETRQADRDNQRNEYDLAAQRVTAWWTQVMGVAALIGMALSAVGVALVWTTFAETRHANELTKAGLEAQLRAWLDVRIGPIQFKSVNGAPTFKTWMVMSNIGQTPALDVSYFMGMALGDDPEKHVHETIEQFISGDLPWSDTTIFHGSKWERDISCEHTGETPDVAPLHIYAVATYRTVFSKQRRFTALAWRAVDRRRDDRQIAFNSLPYSDVLTLSVCDTFSGMAT